MDLSFKDVGYKAIEHPLVRPDKTIFDYNVVFSNPKSLRTCTTYKLLPTVCVCVCVCHCKLELADRTLQMSGNQ